MDASKCPILIHIGTSIHISQGWLHAYQLSALILTLWKGIDCHIIIPSTYPRTNSSTAALYQQHASTLEIEQRRQEINTTSYDCKTEQNRTEQKSNDF